MPRRGENIYKRKDGRWEARYLKSHDNGKAQYISIYAKTYKEIKEKLSLVSEAVTNEKEITQSEKFEAVAMEWLSVYKMQLKASSAVKYLNIINTYLLPTFGSVKVDSISKDNVSDFCNRLLSGEGANHALSAKTVTSIMSVLKSIFEYASEIKQYNVADISGISVKQSQPQLRVLSIVEQQKLCEYLYANKTLCNLGIFLNWFDDGIFSFTVGMRKTDYRIFELILKKTNTPARNCIYIDNVEKFNQIARTLNFNTILFKDGYLLKESFKTFGITI